MHSDHGQKVLVIGAGPVGALAALYAARRGHQVEVYELRSDLRDPSTTPLNFTKSINLALSERGVNSLRQAKCPGLLESVLEETIPMHGRMIHGRQNNKVFEQAQIYDVHGRYIRAIDRAGLNKRLLDELEAMPNVSLYFNHKLTGANFKTNHAWFERQHSSKDKPDPKDRAEEIEIAFDFMIGADGAHSAVRYHLMKFAQMSFQQEYIDTLWCEFTIPPARAGSENARADDFMLSPNHLHIWPAGSFMFIALPSMDKSFTCTLFMSASHFESIDANPDSLIPFFDENFPGVVNTLIAASELKSQYTRNPHLPLISIKCTPYHYSSSGVILGDAAHAMVPFYGQGMNAGLEDVRVLFDILDKHTHAPATRSRDHSSTRAAALQEYTTLRRPDAHAINDLAMGNYREMRSDVKSPFYLLRKTVEELLDFWVPGLGFATQYSRVSFTNQRYSEVEKAAQSQGSVLGFSGAALALCAAAATVAAWQWRAR